MGTLRALAILFCVFAVITTIGAVQNKSYPREVVNASVILEKIERGVPVNYNDKIIEGNINIGDLKLPEVHINRTIVEIDYCRYLEKLKVVRSQITLENCLINGYLNFSNALIQEPVSFGGSTILEDADFRGSQFNQSAYFSYTQFNQSAYFSYAQFDQSAYFWDAQFNQSAYFRSAQFNQSADFWDAQFDRSADFWDAQFDQSANFNGAQFDQSAYFKGAHFGTDAIFDWANLKSADLNQTAISGDLSLKGSQIGSLNLKDADFSRIVLKSWKGIGHMEYDEMTYQLFISNFRNQNLPEAANDCYYDYRNDRRATLPLLYQPVDYALMLFYGYGVKPDRPVLWSLLFMAFFAALFWWRQGILPVREGEPAEEANRFRLLEAIAFSAMTFLSGGKLVFDPPEYKIAPGRPWRDVQISKALFILERLLGMVLIIMFAIAVGKTIILG
ncbi:MAG: pentapeptide repeat-containing protein [Methanothrix sp.]|nr:pentapeptide repeat-containing protein [Methanothrix sp.]